MTSAFEKLIKILREKTPEGSNTVDLLTDIIPMSKEAAYRRLRGEIDFTFNEIMKIANNLDISLDNLNKPEKCLYYKAKITSQIREISFMEDYDRWMESTISDIKYFKLRPEHYIMSLQNSIPALYFYKYEMISKLRLYKWMYQRNTQLKPLKMSEFLIPPRVSHLEKSILKELQQLKVYLIYGQEPVRALIDDITFFHHLNLVSDKEVEQMKIEAFSLVADMEHDAILGMNNEIPCIIHVTNVSFNNDFVFWHAEQFSKITFRFFGVNFFTIDNPNAIDEMKNWIDMLLKGSTQISFSGEKRRIEFFQHQRNILSLL